MTSILWMYYWHANEITLKSSNLPLAIYKSNWYEFSPKMCQAIKIFMKANAKPIIMKAGYINMTLDSFLNVSNINTKYQFLIRINVVHRLPTDCVSDVA